MGGLARVLAVAREPDVYVPASISKRLKHEIASRAKLVEISKSVTLVKGFVTTGEMGAGIEEQSLVVEMDGGLAVLTGCAHQGLENVLGFARERAPIGVVMGGFHGFSELGELEEIDRIFPCHCTVHKSDILAKFPVKAEKCGVGKVIEI
jgi:7,8-dihydropterin-6-yl-methyl-4-(beta-D-ribofuranosyl)aminobenzene 5'-phosphate synthase